MIKDPRVRKRRVAKLISLYGGGTSYTKPWDKLSEAAREEISTKMTFKDSEEPLMAYFSDKSSWALATTERFLWLCEEGVKDLEWREIQDAGPTEEQWRQLERGEISKLDLQVLILLDGNDRQYQILIKPGGGYSLMWSLLTALKA